MKKIIAIVLISAFIINVNDVYASKTAEKEGIQSVSPIDAPDGKVSEASEIMEENEEEEIPAAEMTVPIYNYDISNIVVPSSYALSLNPYSLPIDLGNGSVSTEQVVSRKYGIINKSMTDKIVTVTLTVEDMNKNKITFMDSAEDVKNADENTFALYLAVLPADQSGVKVDGAEVDIDTQASDLSDVEMNGAEEQAITLHEGKNQIRFKLSRSAYDFVDANRPKLGEDDKNTPQKIPELMELSADGKSVTAFTFEGAMNQNAEWGKLLKGIRITAVYDYESADEREKIVKGTGALVAAR